VVEGCGRQVRKKRREERRPGAEMVVVVVRRSKANGSDANQPVHCGRGGLGQQQAARTRTRRRRRRPRVAVIDRGDCAGAAVCCHWLTPGALRGRGPMGIILFLARPGGGLPPSKRTEPRPSW
jgi:hypothetical protein